jgi:regulator of replication initiation timing
MPKEAEYQKELMRMREIFENVDKVKAQLVEGLIEDAAWLRVQNAELKELMAETGMLKVHPEYRQIQKPTEAGKQYLKNVNSYAVIIKTLNGILQKNQLEEEDEFEKFLKEQRNE